MNSTGGDVKGRSRRHSSGSDCSSGSDAILTSREATAEDGGGRPPGGESQRRQKHSGSLGTVWLDFGRFTVTVNKSQQWSNSVNGGQRWSTAVKGRNRARRNGHSKKPSPTVYLVFISGQTERTRTETSK